jgi:hypothetical protein
MYWSPAPLSVLTIRWDADTLDAMQKCGLKFQHPIRGMAMDYADGDAVSILFSRRALRSKHTRSSSIERRI